MVAQMQARRLWHMASFLGPSGTSVANAFSYRVHRVYPMLKLILPCSASPRLCVPGHRAERLTGEERGHGAAIICAVSTTAINDEPQRRAYKGVAILMGILTLYLTFLTFGGYALAGAPLGASILFALASKARNKRSSKWLAAVGALVILAFALFLIWSRVHRYLFPQTSL